MFEDYLYFMSLDFFNFVVMSTTALWMCLLYFPMKLSCIHILLGVK
ncbi:hypothetical protein Hdeb2414_s0007g00228301 [Helianthus debilis subsp. tardiflorus]